MKPATRCARCRLRHMFNRALDWDLLDQSPMMGIKFLPENDARIRYLSREECDRLVESCIVPHLRAIVTVALIPEYAPAKSAASSGTIWTLTRASSSFGTRRTVSRGTSEWIRPSLVCSATIHERRDRNSCSRMLQAAD